MKSILRSTAILGSSSAVTIVIGVASTKIWAVLLGPSGFGLMGLLQGLLGLVSLVAGLGIGTGLIRLGANALAHENDTAVAALYRAAWLLIVSIGSLALLLMIIFQEPISVWMLGSSDYKHYVILVALALLFSLAAGIQTSLLNTYQRVKALAKIGILNSILGTSVGLACVLVWHERGIAPALMAGAIVSWVLPHIFVKYELHSTANKPTRHHILQSAKDLLSFGAPYTASIVVGTGVQLVLPAFVLHRLNTESVGFYRAALAISVNYLGFLIVAMGQDYYPRVAAASERPAELSFLINQQHRLVMLLSVPLILGVLALAPYIVPLIYSPQFLPTIELLQWQLIGDLLKFSSWTMASVVLVRSGSLIYFFTELIAGITTLVASWLGLQWFGLSGLGIGFLITYLVYYIVVWCIVRRSIQFSWSTGNLWMFGSALVMAVSIRVLSIIGMENLRTPIALSFAVFTGMGSIYIIWREINGGSVANT